MERNRVRDEVRTLVREQLSQRLVERGDGGTYETVRVGFMLTFGASSRDNIGRGIEVAEQVNSALLIEAPFRSAVPKPYFHEIGGSARSRDDVELLLFLYVSTCGTP